MTPLNKKIRFKTNYNFRPKKLERIHPLNELFSDWIIYL